MEVKNLAGPPILKIVNSLSKIFFMFGDFIWNIIISIYISYSHDII